MAKRPRHAMWRRPGASATGRQGTLVGYERYRASSAPRTTNTANAADWRSATASAAHSGRARRRTYSTRTASGRSVMGKSVGGCNRRHPWRGSGRSDRRCRWRQRQNCHGNTAWWTASAHSHGHTDAANGRSAYKYCDRHDDYADAGWCGKRSTRPRSRKEPAQGRKGKRRTQGTARRTRNAVANYDMSRESCSQMDQ
jgi:hypothetical protein